MSDTPRADAAAQDWASSANLASELERELAAVTAERDMLREAAATLIIRLPERMESIIRGMHEDDVIPLHDAIEAVRAALRRP